MTIAILITFFTSMLIGIPLFIALLTAGFVGFIFIGDLSLLKIIPQQFFGGMDTFSLMAIPLFIYAGSLMNESGLTDRLLRITKSLVGHLRGGLGYVNILASILFAGINGSASADTSALGSVLIPAMAKEGYSRSYAAGLTAGSSLIGPIIPPSIFMILYANMTNTSIGGLFIAGILPGLLLGAAFAVMNFYYSVKYKFPVSDKKADRKEILDSFIYSLPAIIAPLVIMGGILFGIFTPTESSAIAVIYIVLAGFFLTKKLTLRKLWDAAVESARLTSAIFLIIGAAIVIGWLLTYARVPTLFGEFVSRNVESPLAILFLLSGIIFILGMFMEEIASLVLLTPIFAPLAISVGIDPFHFGIVMVLNITIALITPPMGACVFIASAVGKVELGLLFKKIWPFVITAIIALILIILFPPITTLLPSLFKF
ncbi:MAG: TRAP transporter large permease [Bacteroidales bacterium]|jgi:tripartite ATP-independent transporter DctM subunit|nr:TRAP transporter large permease [Bacteroidales bacterium]